MLLFTASPTDRVRDLPPFRPPILEADTPRKWLLDTTAASAPEPAASKVAITSQAFVKKLCAFVRLDSEEIAALDSLVRMARRRSAGEIVFYQYGHADHVCVILEGLAFRYKMLAGGGRQIVGYLLPGDLCDVQLALVDRLDYNVALLTDCKVAMVPVARLLELAQGYPRIARAIMLAALLDQAILRQWLLNIGQRDARRRLAHFFCEMHWRAKVVGGVEHDGSIALPINQYALADTVGLTPVHVNRTLQRLRNDRMISLRNRRLIILDHPGLSRHAEFDGEYLHALRTAG